MKKVLFIEDEMMTAVVYKHHLTTAGYEVEVADDGHKGLAALAIFPPDLLLLDLMLPRVDGIEILRRIRSNPASKTMPVIVLTNAYAPDSISNAQKAGATRCFVKAKTTVEEVLGAIREALDQTPPTPKSSSPALAAPAHSTTGAEAGLAAPLHVHDDFLESAPQELMALRTLAQLLLKADRHDLRTAMLFDLYRKIHKLSARAALARAPMFAQMASAIEAFVSELDQKPQRIDASTMRTLQHSIEFLGTLFTKATARALDETIDFKIMSVDDEDFARRAVTVALDRAYLKSVSVADPIAAYDMLRKDQFDLVITDINMPGMNGFELCQRLRMLPGYKNIPVIFITYLNGFEARVRSAESGGTDFIAKPFLDVELGVKAVTHVLTGQLKAPPSPSGFKAFASI